MVKDKNFLSYTMVYRAKFQIMELKWPYLFSIIYLEQLTCGVTSHDRDHGTHFLTLTKSVEAYLSFKDISEIGFTGPHHKVQLFFI